MAMAAGPITTMSSAGSSARVPRAGAAPTIYDVARECGVAASTVSRAFSRPGRVRAETALRIQQATERIGYRVNPLARAVTTGRTSLLALAVADVTKPMFVAVVRGAESAAAAAGYSLLLQDTQESARVEQQALDRSLPMVEGVVLTSPRMGDAAIRHVAGRTPLVVLNRVVPGVPSVLTDNPRGARRVLEHLGELGHRSITCVAGPEASWADGTRWRALREGAAELELAVRRVGPFLPTVAGGLAAVAELRRHPSTAVVAYNDLLAIGVLRGWRPPASGCPSRSAWSGSTTSSARTSARPR